MSKVQNVIVLLLVVYAMPSAQESRAKRQRIRAVSVTLYQDEFYNTITGDSYTYIIAVGECTNLDTDWNDQISSLDPGNACIIVYEGQNCKGKNARLMRNSVGINKFSEIELNDAVSSLQTC